MKPRIGVSCHPRVIDTVIGQVRSHTVSRLYVDAVLRAGGVPVLVPLLDPDDVERAVDGLEGVVLTGGGDVGPHRYGDQPVPETNGVDEARDSFDLRLFEVATGRGLPVLAVCRGLQVANVALGGTLVQHVPAITGQDHCRLDQWSAGVHAVRVEPDSRLARALGTVELRVNSTHHQAVGQPAGALRPVAWAEDGTIEAVELDGQRLLAVQWHPEMLADRPEQQRLYRWLVEEASR